MRIARTTSIIALAIAALGTGVAVAQTPPTARPDRTAPTTRAEAQSRAEAMFARMDANRDGRLTAEDRAAGENAHHAEMFGRIDTNNDGSISRAEWDAHHAAREADHAAGDHHYGPDGDEMVQGGRPEGRAMRGRRGGRGGGRGGDMMMRRADTNNDGGVDRAEFVASALQRFDRSDANHDGTLTAAEREAARAAMRGRMDRGDGRGPMGDGDMPPPPPPAF